MVDYSSTFAILKNGILKESNNIRPELLPEEPFKGPGAGKSAMSTRPNIPFRPYLINEDTVKTTVMVPNLTKKHIKTFRIGKYEISISKNID